MLKFLIFEPTCAIIMVGSYASISDPRLQTWNTVQGLCMFVSNQGVFAVSIMQQWIMLLTLKQALVLVFQIIQHFYDL